MALSSIIMVARAVVVQPIRTFGLPKQAVASQGEKDRPSKTLGEILSGRKGIATERDPALKPCLSPEEREEYLTTIVDSPDHLLSRRVSEGLEIALKTSDPYILSGLAHELTSKMRRYSEPGNAEQLLRATKLIEKVLGGRNALYQSGRETDAIDKRVDERVYWSLVNLLDTPGLMPAVIDLLESATAGATTIYQRAHLVGAVSARLTHSEPDTKIVTLMALVRMVPYLDDFSSRQDLVHEISKLLKDPDEQVSQRAAWALFRIAPEYPALKRLRIGGMLVADWARRMNQEFDSRANAFGRRLDIDIPLTPEERRLQEKTPGRR